MHLFNKDVLKVDKAGGLIFIFLLLSCRGTAQIPSLNTSIDKKGILIGEHLQYKLEASFPANTYKINWLGIADSVNHFDVIERRRTDSSFTGNLLNVKRTITLTSFDSGVWTIPAFVIKFEPLTGNKAYHLFTDSIRINVSFSPLDSTKTFHDIKTILDVSDKWPLWMWIAAGLLGLLLIGLSYYIIKKLIRRKPEAALISKLSPLEEAMQSLNELQNQQLLVKGEVKQYYSRLSDIFKRYVSRKTNSDFFNLTTDEILIRVNDISISKKNIVLIANSLRMSDAVKFAKYIPDMPAGEAVFLDIKNVISQTDQLTIINKSDI
jgi:hypothetical protein